MFLGGTPHNTPALYSLMNYADIAGGTWYPKGGMYKITQAFVALANELGVKFLYNQNVVKFNIEDSIVKSIVNQDGKIFTADYILCGAEYPFVQMNLIDKKHRTYDSNYWAKREVAPSALIFYIGLSKKIDSFEHHNLFFDAGFDETSC